MSAVTTSISASEVARGLSIFEIDESLAALVEAAEAERRNLSCLALRGPQRRTRWKSMGQPRDGIPVV